MKILKKASPRADRVRKAKGLNVETTMAMTAGGVGLVAKQDNVGSVEVLAETPAEAVSPVAEILLATDSVPTTETIPETEAKYLSDEAFAQRKEDVKNPNLRAVSADHVVRAWATKLATETNRDLVTTPINLQEYVDYRDTEVAKKTTAPKGNNSKVFLSEVYEKHLREIPDWVRTKMFEKFSGREGIGEDGVLVGLAEIRISVPKSVEINLKIDGGGIETCSNPECPTGRFVPMTFMNKEFMIGNFLAVAGRVQPYCFECRAAVRGAIFAEQKVWRGLAEQERMKTAFPAVPFFLSRAEAEKRAERQAYAIGKQAEEDAREKDFQVERQRRKEAIRNGALGTIGGLMNTKRREAASRPSGPAKQVSDEVIKRLSRNLFLDLLDGRMGEYATRFTWTQNDQEIETSIHARVEKYAIVIVAAGPGLSNLVGKSFTLDALPKFLFAAFKKAAAAQAGK